MAKDLLGRSVVTAAELDTMTPAERQAAFDASIVMDLSSLPEVFRAQLLTDAGDVLGDDAKPGEGAGRGAARAS